MGRMVNVSENCYKFSTFITLLLGARASCPRRHDAGGDARAPRGRPRSARASCSRRRDVARIARAPRGRPRSARASSPRRRDAGGTPALPGVTPGLNGRWGNRYAARCTESGIDQNDESGYNVKNLSRFIRPSGHTYITSQQYPSGRAHPVVARHVCRFCWLHVLMGTRSGVSLCRRSRVRSGFYDEWQWCVATTAVGDRQRQP